jgi:hypothetical protein
MPDVHTMSAEQYLPYALLTIAGLLLLLVVTRLKYRDARAQSERLRSDLLRLEVQRFNRQRPKAYHYRSGGESE